MKRKRTTTITKTVIYVSNDNKDTIKTISFNDDLTYNELCNKIQTDLKITDKFELFNNDGGDTEYNNIEDVKFIVEKMINDIEDTF